MGAGHPFRETQGFPKAATSLKGSVTGEGVFPALSSCPARETQSDPGQKGNVCVCVCVHMHMWGCFLW